MESRSLQDICCLTQATLFHVCLSHEDLEALGAWDTQPSSTGYSPAVWCRAFLHKACRADATVARRVADLLDLRYLDTVLLLRRRDPAELEAVVERWLEEPGGQALPGLLWGLCSDRRPEVHALGTRLAHEASTVAWRALVAP